MMYKDRDGNYHAVFHLLYNTRPLDPQCAGRGTKFLGGHAFSPKGDGLNWTFTGVAYDGNVSPQPIRSCLLVAPGACSYFTGCWL